MKASLGHFSIPRSAVLFVPLLLVNSAAVYGQQGWFYDRLHLGRVVAVLFACAVESIGIYLAVEAHAARMAGDAYSRLLLGSYAVGLLAGALNYAHFTTSGFTPNAVAISFGVLSSISPWLWAIRSRSLNRDRLRELGLIDPRAVRFSIMRWVFFPIRTFRVFRHALWHGIVEPTEAIASAEQATPPVMVSTVKSESEIEAAEAARTRNSRGEKTAKEVEKVATRNPDLTPTQIAARLGKSEKTVRAYLPKKTPELAGEVAS